MDEEEESGIPDAEEDESYPWKPSHVVADSLLLAAAIARANADHLELLAFRAAYDHNYKVDREDFAAKAAKELETIMNPTEE